VCQFVSAFFGLRHSNTNSDKYLRVHIRMVTCETDVSGDTQHWVPFNRAFTNDTCNYISFADSIRNWINPSTIASGPITASKSIREKSNNFGDSNKWTAFCNDYVANCRGHNSCGQCHSNSRCQEL
jgi:hypothetical protein